MEATSVHYKTERRSRDNFINEYIGEGAIVDSFVVDRGHPDGPEIHSVTTTGIIIIQNKNTRKLITQLIARPEQLRRLYRLIGSEPPKSLMKLAYKHNRKRNNEV